MVRQAHHDNVTLSPSKRHHETTNCHPVEENVIHPELVILELVEGWFFG
jgi:hypothetical protein